jgi:hypothetical protein
MANVHNVASDWNMIHMALLVVALEGEGTKPARHAMDALRSLRRATRGWQNGGYLACALLAGMQNDRGSIVEELRETLLTMPATEVPWEGTARVDRSRPVPLELRPVNVWAWKQSPFREEVGRESAVPDPATTGTRADFLFAYWLARAAGELDPGPLPPPEPPSPPPPAEPR